MDADAERQSGVRRPSPHRLRRGYGRRWPVASPSACRRATGLMREPARSRIRWVRTCRLIATRYPSAGLFDRVARPADLDAVLELEAWTNDRISNELGLLQMIPRDEWVFGPMGSVVMAAFCHPRPI